MWKYIVKRIALMIPIVLAVTFVIFLVMNLNTDMLAYSSLGNDATPEAVEAWMHEKGLDKPVLYRFGKYVYDVVVKHDMGRSYSWNREVWPDIVKKTPVSLKLAASGMAVACIIGIPVGVISAVRQYSWTDRISTVSALFISAVPSFWLAMMLQLFFVVKLKLLPASGAETWKHFILPSLSLGIPYAASELRYTRSSLLETIRQEYIDTARSKGVPERVVIRKHALKNAMLPVITVTGNSFGGLIGGAVVNETIYALPGLGYFLSQGINNREQNIVCGCVIVVSIMYSFVILIVDILHALIDPRVKARYAKKG